MRYLRTLKRKLSQRGAFLLVLAVVDLIYANALIDPPPETRASATYTFYSALAPLPVWGLLWTFVGLLCLVLAWTPDDRLAYGFATGLKIFWSLLHVGGWAAGVVPRGYVLGVIWLAMAAGVMIVSTVEKGGADRA